MSTSTAASPGPVPVSSGLPIPVDWHEIDAAWMTAALAAHHPDAVVGDVTVIERDDGTNRRARLALTFTSGRGPATVFAKADEPAHHETHVRTGNLVNEPLLFAAGAELPVEAPLVYAAIAEGHRYVLVMEDLRERGADMRDSRSPLTVGQAANGVGDLARLHRRHRGADDPALGFVQPWRATDGFRTGLGRRIPTGLERAGDAVPGAIHDLGPEGIVELWARFVDLLGHDPTLLHGDAHIGNTYVLPDDRVGFLDWQVVRTGTWAQDVGYFVQGSLVAEDCRDAERDLVETHRAIYSVGRDDGPTAADAWTWYRASAAYGLAIWLSTLGSDGYQLPEVSLALADRYAAAFLALDTTSALAELEVRPR